MGVLMLMSSSGCNNVTVLVVNLVLRSVIATVLSLLQLLSDHLQRKKQQLCFLSVCLDDALRWCLETMP